MHVMILGIGFAIGLLVGLKVPIFGDAIAMLVIGVLLMVSQYYLLKDQLNISSDWIIYSFAGLIIGVGGSFVFILLTTRFFGLTKSHIYSFPISLFVLTTFQAFLLKNTFSNLMIWPSISLFALFVASIILFAINSRWDLAFDLLGDRRPELNKAPVWGFTGIVIGLIYGLITGYGLKA